MKDDKWSRKWMFINWTDRNWQIPSSDSQLQLGQIPYTVNNDLPKFRDLVSIGTKVKFLGCLDVNVYQHMVNLYKLGFIYKKL